MITCCCALPDCMANGCARVRSGEIMVAMPVPDSIPHKNIVYADCQLPKILKHFKYDHLSPALQEVSKPFYELAYQVARRSAYSSETEVSLRKLLEAKDAAIRAVCDF